MNVHLVLRKILRKPTCVRQASTRVMAPARIINMGSTDAAITLGHHTIVRGELLVFAHGGRIRVGDHCYIGEGTRIWSGAQVLIGQRVMIAHGVNVFDNLTHPLGPRARHEHFRAIYERGHPRDIDLGDRPVVVEDDAWIGAGATVLRGVTIGRGAILAAGAVLTRDLAPMCIAAGNPAAVIRRLNEDGSTKPP